MPGRYGSNLQFVRVDSPDIMTIRGKTGRGDGADIAEAEDSDSHAAKGDRASKPQWDDFIRQTSGGTALRYTAAYPRWLLSARVTQARLGKSRLSVDQEARLRRAFAGLGVASSLSGDHPTRRANATAASCELTPSFWRIDLICERIVEMDKNAAFAISSAQWPSINSARTTFSRLVSAAKSCSPGSGQGRSAGAEATDADAPWSACG